MDTIYESNSTDISLELRFLDSAGQPVTGLAFDTAGLALNYYRPGAAQVSITPVTLASLAAVHTDGGFLEIGDGYYRVDVPDAAFAAGAHHVLIKGSSTGGTVVPVYALLQTYDLSELGSRQQTISDQITTMQTQQNTIEAFVTEIGNNGDGLTDITLPQATLDAIRDAVRTTQMTESYAANGVAPTLEQAVLAIHQRLMQFGIVGTNLTVRQLDNATTAFVVALNSASNPTDASRT